MSFNPAWHLAEEEDGLSPESGRGDGPYSEADVGEAAVVRVEADKDDLPCTSTDKHSERTDGRDQEEGVCVCVLGANWALVWRTGRSRQRRPAVHEHE